MRIRAGAHLSLVLVKYDPELTVEFRLVQQLTEQRAAGGHFLTFLGCLKKKDRLLEMVYTISNTDV